MSSYLLECCVDSAESALNAALGGADRLELCSGLVIGGITPTLSLYEQIRSRIDLPVHILIRPRFGDFLYSEEELSVMEADIRAFRRAGAQVLVVGADLDVRRDLSHELRRGRHTLAAHLLGLGAAAQRQKRQYRQKHQPYFLFAQCVCPLPGPVGAQAHS